MSFETFESRPNPHRRPPEVPGTPYGPYVIDRHVGDCETAENVWVVCALKCGYRRTQKRSCLSHLHDVANCAGCRGTGVLQVSERREPVQRRPKGICPRCDKNKKRPGEAYCLSCQTAINHERAVARKEKRESKAAAE